MLNIKSFVFVIVLFILTFYSVGLIANEPRVVHLTPPQISQTTISEKIVCTRPKREGGKFNISVQQHLDKTIVNCYGHGGAGWTALFGSVNLAIEMYEKTQPSIDTPIRIIGSGCMGLTMAIELHRLGYHVAGIYTKDLYDLPSWKAAGYFAMIPGKTSQEEKEKLNKISSDTFLTYQKIYRGEHPYIAKEAVRYIPVYCNADIEAGVEDLEAKGMIPLREYVSIDFGNGVIHHNFVKYMSYFLNTASLMRQFSDRVRSLNIEIEIREIKAFDEMSEEVIFNCSGLGGRELNADTSMIPLRGHLVTLNEAAGTEHMDYMVCTRVEQDGKEEHIYMFPKSLSVTSENICGLPCCGVLGGTFISNFEKLPSEIQEQLDQVEFKRLLNRNSQFFHGHPFIE